MTKRCLTLACACLSLLIANAPAWGHDDGLTCHSHPGPPRPAIDFVGSGPSDECVAYEIVLHAFDNLTAAKLADGTQDFTRADVVSALGAAAEFGQMVEAVRLLALRIDRADTPTDEARAQRTAQDAFNRLPIATYLAFDIFLAEARQGDVVIVALAAFIDYLESEAGVAAVLTAELSAALGACV